MKVATCTRPPHCKNPQSPNTAPLLDRTDRGGNIGRLLMVGLVLLGIVGAFLVVPERYAETMTLTLLAVLSMLGVFLRIRTVHRFHPPDGP